jgi:hypothetical protein
VPHPHDPTAQDDEPGLDAVPARRAIEGVIENAATQDAASLRTHGPSLAPLVSRWGPEASRKAMIHDSMPENGGMKKTAGRIALLLLVVPGVAADNDSLTVETRGPAFDHMLQAAVDEDLVILFADRDSCVVTGSRAYAERAITFSAVCDDETVRISTGHNNTFAMIAEQWALGIKTRAATAPERETGN